MTTQTLTLTDFLLARIAEDEEAARDALRDGEGQAEPEPWKAVGWPASEHPGAVVLIDPARVLAECEAKRKIIALHHAPKPWAPNHDPSCSSQDYAETSADCETLRALALPYADHPDCRDEWRP